MLRSNSSLEISVVHVRPEFGSSLSINSEPRPKFRLWSQRATTPKSASSVEHARRRTSLRHYDLVSVRSSRQQQRHPQRRNTATGASAARAGTGDSGDGRGNSLIASCPEFRNEIGAESERRIFLSRDIALSTVQTPITCLSLFDADTPDVHCCRTWHLERDNGALFYRQRMFGFEHQNWFGTDPVLGACAISIRRQGTDHHVIVRTCDTQPLRATVSADSVPALRSHAHHHPNNHHAREVLEWACPELSVSCLRLATPTADELILRLDESGISRHYKVGVLYCGSHQHSEEQMYNNEHGSASFDEFQRLLGTRVRLNGWDKYRGGLDVRGDSCGTHSLYTTIDDCEVMFHVSTLLPFTHNNRQQLMRKRHIGNDIVTIVFQERDALPFSAAHVRSHFQHVFIIVRVVDRRHYRIAVSRSSSVPPFGPLLPNNGLFVRDARFVRFLLLKAINGECAAHSADKFASMAQRTRHELLTDLASRHVTTTTIDSVQSCTSTAARIAALFRRTPHGSSSSHARFNPTGSGAIVWHARVDDFPARTQLDAIVAVSTRVVAIVERSTRHVAFVTPTDSILGWHRVNHALKVYFHRGECIHIHTPDAEEIVERLRHVTSGVDAQSMTLHRDGRHFGFVIDRDATVSSVSGSAATAGLIVGARVVEVCHVITASVPHAETLDLLQTSPTVTITVLMNAPRICDRCDEIIVCAEPAHVLCDSTTPIVDSETIDWTTLVDTATRALTPPETHMLWSYEERVKRLQTDLSREQIQKTTLEATVKRLKEENERLHLESQTAAQQLRRFTEWYWSQFNN